MRLVPIDKYIGLRFPLGGPHPVTVRTWCRNGDQPGAVKRGNIWFIDLDIEENTTGNSLVDAALQARRKAS
ncbi:DNA-binding protein [Sansalvadorimonas verongulae]|uniref:DNA-binding protein n=1 Tax=Sansalvadorimonas verongulae TaxID=2172824 RepID=UPI0012BC95AB|nr:DNA-binding protein [Sansalvadorimonas verongulae]MTI12143.1 DNA-binding protein [Sansalvadorimonas verongulae]